MVRVGMQVSSRYWEITINTCHHPLWAFFILMNIQQFPFYASSTFRAWNKGMQLIEMLICTSAGHHFSTYTAALQVALAMQRMQIKVGCWHIPLTVGTEDKRGSVDVLGSHGPCFTYSPFR